MLICLALTSTSSSIALLFFPLPLCASSNHLSFCVCTPLFLLHPSLPAWRGCVSINSVRPKKEKKKKSGPLSPRLPNYLARLGDMESRSSHFNQSMCVCMSACLNVFVCVCVSASVPVEAIRWSWCLAERKGQRQDG